MMRKAFTVLLLLILSLSCARAQRYTFGTNAVDILTFGTLNAEASASFSRHGSVHVGAELNPWEFRSGDPERQLQVKQMSYWGGLRYWPWYVYSGWWAGADARYTVYNGGGVIERDTEEGTAWGGGLYAGYGIMLSDRWNLDLGVGLWGGYKSYTRYSCPLCGRVTDEGETWFAVPDARIAVQLVF